MRGSSVLGHTRGFSAWPQAQEHFGVEPMLSEGLDHERRKDVKKAMRKMLLEPLPRPPGAFPESNMSAMASLTPKPPLAPRRPQASKDRGQDSENFVLPLRPRTAEGGVRCVERPQTADRTAPRLGSIRFASQLHLRPFAELPGADNPWASPGEAFVIALEMQDMVREAASHTGIDLVDGMQVTIWTTTTDPDKGTCILEPLVARRLDRSMAVEPVEVVVESTASSSGAQPLRFGQGFRLRLAGGGLYLSHANGHIHWERPHPEEDQQWPHDSRFTAHGGELGAPVRLGRHVSMQRINSPPASDSESEVESSSESDSERILRGAPPRRCCRAKPVAASAKSGGYNSTGATTKEFGDDLISRLADRDSVLPITILQPVALS